MTKIILCGCSGHMGHVVTEIAAADAEVEIVAGIDLSGTKDASYPVFASLKDCDVKADALIDFSSPKALDAILTYCMEDVYKRQVILQPLGKHTSSPSWIRASAISCSAHRYSGQMRFLRSHRSHLSRW